MNLGTTLALGGVAGGTIVLGLPVARIRTLPATARVLLSAGAVGVLLFLLQDVLSAAWEPLDAQLAAPGSPRLPVLAAVFAGGIAAGLLTVVAYERALARRRGTAGGLAPRRLAVLVAVGIGVHNLAEGLAIGRSAASGSVGIAAVLVVGFALHNATEGFGVVAPLAGGDARPSWGFLLVLGAIAGGPTFLGTALGWAWGGEDASVLFLALAAGSILFVIVQLLGVVGKAHRIDLVAYGVLAGLLAGYATDAVLTFGGA
jgi:ZIP family zinc transporter